MVPCLVSSYVASLVASLFSVHYLSYKINIISDFSFKLLLVVLLAGLSFGLIGSLFIKALTLLKDLYSKYFKNYLLKSLVAGLVVLLFLLILNFRKYGGLILWMMEESFIGKSSFLDSFLKFVVIVLSLGSGFIGGEATPLFDIGDSFGSSLGLLFGFEPSLFAALGLIGVFGNATNTPLTIIILGIELFGTRGLSFYIIIAVVSYYVIGHNSIYSDQRVDLVKFSNSEHYKGRSIDEIKKERKNER